MIVSLLLISGIDLLIVNFIASEIHDYAIRHFNGKERVGVRSLWHVGQKPNVLAQKVIAILNV